MVGDVEHLFMSVWPSVYLLWRDVYSSPLPLFKLAFFFVVVVIDKLLILNRYDALTVMNLTSGKILAGIHFSSTFLGP